MGRVVTAMRDRRRWLAAGGALLLALGAGVLIGWRVWGRDPPSQVSWTPRPVAIDPCSLLPQREALEVLAPATREGRLPDVTVRVFRPAPGASGNRVCRYWLRSGGRALGVDAALTVVVYAMDDGSWERLWDLYERRDRIFTFGLPRGSAADDRSARTRVILDGGPLGWRAFVRSGSVVAQLGSTQIGSLGMLRVIDAIEPRLARAG